MRIGRRFGALGLALMTACAGVREPEDGGRAGAGADAADAAAPCAPVPTDPPNVPDNRPAFPGQTRACAVDSGVAFDVVILARGLEHPWAVEPLPNGDLLVTERPGRLRVVTAAGELRPPIAGLPPVDARGQGGLLDVALSPSFASDRTIYWSYAERRDGGNGTSVARGAISADGRSLEGVEVIFRGEPAYPSTAHFGSRLAFGPDGMLYVTTGERAGRESAPLAQRLDNDLGKVVRIRPDGTVPADNPFAGRDGARPEVWSYGHRNVQAAAFDPAGRLWIVEHGPQGGDEVNLVEPGANYGWPIQTYGEEYSGRPMAGAAAAREGVVPPVYYWDPVIAPSGAVWYTGDAFPAWRGSLFVGGMIAGALVRLELEGDRVTGEERLLVDRGRRIRDVRQGPDGALYVVTDEDDGELWRIAPRR